jgi:hypothetical protein
MNKQLIHLDDRKPENPFKVPEGYFEGLTNQVMVQLPERAGESLKAASVWKRMEPWVYMAAMFIGIALMIRLFVSLPEQSSGLNLTSSSEIDEFYQYYEEQLAKNIYHETIYLEEIDNFDLSENLIY